MLTLDTHNTVWKNPFKAHAPVHVDPMMRDLTIYHLTAVQETEKVPTPTERKLGSDEGMAFRIQREVGLEQEELKVGPVAQEPPSKPYNQQLKEIGLAPEWDSKAGPSGGIDHDSSSHAQAEISSAAKALWQQYVALLAGRAVGPLPMSVINAVASYSSAKQAVAA
jgi:cell wall-associated NlpC family hydrolase